MPAHHPGESIEGLKIEGHSRDPLRSRPMKKENGIKYFVVKAEFDVRAEIITELTSDLSKIDENALIAKGETVGCTSALITMLGQTRTPRIERYIRQEVAPNVTATHGANMWETKKQANVRVVTPHQGIIDAENKRNKNTPLFPG